MLEAWGAPQVARCAVYQGPLGRDAEEGAGEREGGGWRGAADYEGHHDAHQGGGKAWPL